MSEENTGTESVETSESNASSESAATAQTQDASSSNEATSPAQKELPFHEHPRFRELVEQKNSYAQQVQQMQQAYQRQFAEMQAQMQQLQKQQTAPKEPQYGDVFKELEQVNPHFAKLQQEIYGKLSATEQLQQQFEQMQSEIQAERTQREAAHAQSEFSRLCSEAKVSESDKELYMERVANMANARGAKLSDLPALFKEAHQGLSKYLDNVRRAERESYTKAKAGDARPASQTGGAPVGSGKTPTSLDDVKARMAAAMRAAKTP